NATYRTGFQKTGLTGGGPQTLRQMAGGTAMAHIDIVTYRHAVVDRVPLRTAAHTWRTLAVATVALLGVAVVVVGALSVIDAVLPQVKACQSATFTCTTKLKHPAQPEPDGLKPGWPKLSLLQ